MTGMAWRRWLYGLAAAMLASLLLFAATPEARLDPKPPDDARGRAAWLTTHPADWIVAARLSDQALQSSMPRRFDVWRAAHEHAASLTPRHMYARTAFVRGGLFHWPELGAQDRAVVVREAEGLLHDPRVFSSLHEPLWRLTGDFAVIRRGAPKTQNALYQLRDLTVREGLFAEYRELRDALRRQRMMDFEAMKATASPVDLIRLLPRDLDAADRPFVQALLDHLQQHPLDANPERPEHAAELIDFAIREQMRPLDGIDYFLRDADSAPEPDRARLALALGRTDAATQIRLAARDVAEAAWAQYHRERGEPARIDPAKWQGVCGSHDDLCRVATREIAVGAGGTIAIELEAVERDDVAPYVEIYLDRQLVAEGAIDGRKRFEVNAAPGTHALELRLVNRVTRNETYRLVRLSSVES